MGSLGAIGWVVPFLVALALQVPGEAHVAPTPPRVEGKPVGVAIGFYILDFARITTREETFDATGYLEISWLDPSLARPDASQADPGSSRRLDVSSIWTPRVFFLNAVEPPRYHDDPVVEVDARGMVTSWAIVSGKFSAFMDLRRFPFDRQTLPVKISAFEGESVVKFETKPELTMIDPEAAVTDWTIESTGARVESRVYVPGQESYTHYVYEVGVRRRPAFFVWRAMVPLALLTAVSFAAFWFEPVGLQPQISTCMAALISLVAFNFAIDFSLPKEAYLTIIDRHALTGFAFVAAGVVVVTLVHLAVKRDRLDLARRIQSVARWTLPLAYVMAVLLNLSLPG